MSLGISFEGLELEIELLIETESGVFGNLRDSFCAILKIGDERGRFDLEFFVMIVVRIVSRKRWIGCFW